LQASAIDSALQAFITRSRWPRAWSGSSGLSRRASQPSTLRWAISPGTSGATVFGTPARDDVAQLGCQ
jgi:hypothetical protein